MKYLFSKLIHCLFAAFTVVTVIGCSNTIEAESASAKHKLVPGYGPQLVESELARFADQRWKPVANMSDEFSGDALDLQKWQAEPKGDGWVWIGRAPALFRAENVVVKNGLMNVTVGKLPEPVQYGDNRYTHQGAIVRSRNPGQLGWYFEARMKANQTVMSSTFWLMTKGQTKKKLELDIQECVGRTTELSEPWAQGWDQIYHSNMIHRVNKHNPDHTQIQNYVTTETKNWERFYTYGAWWKSDKEVQFFLDGKYVYSIVPSIEWDVPAFIQMAIETYDWNPIPADGGLVESGTWEQRTTQYDWVRVWQPAD